MQSRDSYLELEILQQSTPSIERVVNIGAKKQQSSNTFGEELSG